jgi:hypothetical protein
LSTVTAGKPWVNSGFTFFLIRGRDQGKDVIAYGYSCFETDETSGCAFASLVYFIKVFINHPWLDLAAAVVDELLANLP